jgi:hypothetical protein
VTKLHHLNNVIKTTGYVIATRELKLKAATSGTGPKEPFDNWKNAGARLECAHEQEAAVRSRLASSPIRMTG